MKLLLPGTLVKMKDNFHTREYKINNEFGMILSRLECQGQCSYDIYFPINNDEGAWFNEGEDFIVLEDLLKDYRKSP